MVEHILLLLAICILGFVFFYNGISYKKNLYYVIISFFLIFLMQSLRSASVGADTNAYMNGFYRINALNNSWEEQNWEPLYVMLNKLVGLVSPTNAQLLLVAVSAIILTGIGIFIVASCGKDISTFWPVFFFMTLNHYLTSMVSLRQYCALAIAINVYTVLKKTVNFKNIIFSILLIFVATCFHSSAVASIVLLVLCLSKIVDKKKIMLCVAMCIIVFVFFDKLLNLVFSLFPKYNIYSIINHEKYAGVEFGQVYLLFLFVNIGICCLVFALNSKRSENRELYVLVCFVLIGSGISLLTTKVALVWRFGYYFDIFLLLLLPKVINRIKLNKIAIYSMCFLLGWGYYIYLLLTNKSLCVPYSVFWK